MNEQVNPAPGRRISWPSVASVALSAWAVLPLGFGLHLLERTLVAIIAFVFGVVALIEISKSRGLVTGRWLAIPGLALSCFCMLIAALSLVQDRMEGKSARADCLRNMKLVGIAIAMYADQHEGTIPKTFDDLRPYASDLDRLLICPSAKNTNTPSYQILLGGKKWNSPETIDAVVMTEPLSNHHDAGRNALCGDGHVKWLSPSAPINNP